VNTEGEMGVKLAMDVWEWFRWVQSGR